jgi:hypothetical protein
MSQFENPNNDTGEILEEATPEVTSNLEGFRYQSRVDG